MVRTSLDRPSTAHHRLPQASKRKLQSVSALVMNVVDQALAAHETARLHHLYDELDKLEQVAVGGVTSTMIDDVLYGDGLYAAWKGNGAGDSL